MKTKITLITVLSLFLSINSFAQSARVQAIHNCPDPAAATVDVWLNNTLLLDNFNYKEASPYIDAPTMEAFDLVITAPDAMDTTNAIFRKSFTLMSETAYTVIASGGLAETGSTAFDLRAYAGLESANNMDAGEVSVNIIHSSYDAPMVDIYEVQIPAGMLVDDLAFGQDIGEYVNLPATDFDVQVRTQAGIVAAEFDVNVTGLDNNALTVIATGYLDTDNAVGDEPFGLLAILTDGTVVELPMKDITAARVQAIHNTPDPAAATVDVWLNDMPLIQGFNYKAASPYIDAPAGQYFDLSITAPGAADTTNAIFKKTFLLESAMAYSVVASGGLAEMGETAFDLRGFAGLEAANNQDAGEVSVNIIHGSYDAPMVDIYEVQIPAGLLVDDLSFGEALESYVNLPAADFDVQVRTQEGVAAAQFDVNVTGLDNNAVTVLATGYLDPANAVGDEPFGLLAILTDGTVVELPAQEISTARVQVIHNSAATDAAMVDVYLNDGLLIDNFEFRTASPFIDAPAGRFFDVSIALPNSMDTVGALYKETFLLESNMTYIVVASGVIGSGMYDPATDFSLEVIADAREMSMTSGNVDVLVWHGATDAPTVDVVETLVGAGTIVDDLSYGEYQGYLDLPATAYRLDVRDETGSTTVATYQVDLSGLEDLAISVIASGFLNPAMNNNGEAFGLFAALPSGGALLSLDNVTSIEDLDLGVNLNVSPNPFRDFLRIDVQAEQSASIDYMIYDAAGRLYLSDQTRLQDGNNRLDINTTEMNAGFYTLIIKNENGSTQNVKLIKQ